MKGGKAGRPRKSAAGETPPRPGSGRGKPVKGNAKRPPSTPPKKGSRKNPGFGGMSTRDDV